MTIRTNEPDPIAQVGRKRPGKSEIENLNSREKLVDALFDRIRVHVEHTDTSTLHEMFNRLDQSEPQENAEQSVTALVDTLSQGRHFSPDETLLMELELQRRAFELRRKLLSGALTTTQVAQLLGTRRQTPHDRVKSGTLLGIEENRRWLFPYWQFDAAGPNGVVNGLPDTLRALRTSAVAKANWLTLPNPSLEGRSPLQALKDGDLERVKDIAQAVGAN